MSNINLSLNQIKQRKNSHLHSELHLLVDEVRIQFNETAKKGPGSFGFYLGFFKRLGLNRVKKLLGEMKESKDPKSVKLFWWKIKQELNKNS